VTGASTETDTSRVAERLAELVGGSAGAAKIFGDAVERDGVTIVPVGRIRWGFGGGGGHEKGGTEPGGEGSSGSGGGGGATVRPIGFIEISDGRARFRRIVDPSTVAAVLCTVAALGFVLFRRRRGGRGGAVPCAATGVRRDRREARVHARSGGETS